MTYDEFSMFADNAADAGLDRTSDPTVRRVDTVVEGLVVSTLVWGESPPELVLLHGGAQNAHTWDTVALALDRPLIAIDLPGHGHSDWRPKQDYLPQVLSNEVADVVATLAPTADAVIGMSMGGLTAVCLAADRPELVRRLGVVDVTPGTDHEKAEPIVSFVDGPEFFESFEAILERTIEHNPTRSESSLRRGILHNARELDDGRWSWRYDPMRGWKSEGGEMPDFGDLWDKVAAVVAPIDLWQGGAWSVVSDEDVERFRSLQPEVRHTVVADAGHSIQGDQPLRLCELIEDLLSRPVSQ
ncbi:MAG: alpha/beta hydrolase [Acidobacteria bacterium]|nr:alpha/beta hydrolase [Acidobacteriota bacterium]